MALRFMEKGMLVYIHEETDAQPVKTHEAAFVEYASDISFYARDAELTAAVREGVRYRVNFARGATMYTFVAVAKEPEFGAPGGAALFEQVSEMEQSSRRKYERYETKLKVDLYGILRGDLERGDIKKAEPEPVFSCETMDISVSGLCLVSNRLLKSQYEPYFLAEFSLSPTYHFLLPSMLARKGSCTRSAIYKYEYGIQYLYDAIPDEKERMIFAIFNTRFDMFGRR